MSRYRILIVDDQIDIRRMLRIGVENLGQGFMTLDVPSAEEALLEIMRQPVDLLISDIRLPGISGVELIAKARRRQPDLKIILITALNDLPTLQQAAEMGANALFHKPLDMLVFLDHVKRTLGVASLTSPAPSDAPFSPVEGLGDRLARLRKECAASAAVLLNEQGQVLAQAGVLPESTSPAPSDAPFSSRR
jgi:DNA-binding NtrC family response regulator